MTDNTSLVEMYRQMVRIRTFEETLAKVYMEGKTPVFDIAAGTLPGELHLAAGQEPAAVGVCAHLRSTDAVTAPHRLHHIALARGVDMKRMAAEILGKESGLCRGKGGHMHLFDASTNFGCSGIVAEGLPTAVGYALAFQKHKRDDVAVAFFGEGGANQGAFHESLNLAALWRLAVVFVCEDNEWAVSVAKSKSTCVPNNSDRASAYGVPGTLVSDNDPVHVFEAAALAIVRARGGHGPSLIEVKTDRLMGHFQGDTQAYRSKQELEIIQQRDCLPRFGRQLLDTGVLKEGELVHIGELAKAEVDEAIDFARSSPYPAPETALLHVFA